MKFQNDQEAFWAGEFGEIYITRNQSPFLLASNISFFSKVLGSTYDIKTCIEFGPNIGMNLKALQYLHPKLELFGLEINKKAAKILAKNIPPQNVINDSFLNFKSEFMWDLVVVKGVLIHLNPNSLLKAYEKIFNASKKYILIAEYYSPSPVSVEYRGHKDKLFKRDFAGELLDLYSSLKLRDYGFCYHLDPNFPQDDITWFLLEKV